MQADIYFNKGRWPDLQTNRKIYISESTVENQLSIALKKIGNSIRYTFRHN
jgi:hypothetical protein